MSDSQLFDKIVNVRIFASDEQLDKCNSESIAVDLRWVDLRKHFTSRHTFHVQM